MKKLNTFEEFLNENLRLGKTDKLLSKMTVTDFDGKKWDMSVVECDNALNPNDPDFGKEVYITIAGEYAKSATDSDVWIPKDQWDAFKKMINSI